MTSPAKRVCTPPRPRGRSRVRRIARSIAHTRERVIEAAARLGYQPNAMARSLKTASAGAIGMLVPSLRNPFWSQVMRAVVRRAWERELVVLVAEDTGDEATEKAYERLVAQARIDGLIVTSASATAHCPGA